MPKTKAELVQDLDRHGAHWEGILGQKVILPGGMYDRLQALGCDMSHYIRSEKLPEG